jgi:hypothetical protein
MKTKHQLLNEFSERNNNDQRTPVLKPIACRKLTVEDHIQNIKPAFNSDRDSLESHKPITVDNINRYNIGNTTKMTRAEYIQAQKNMFLSQNIQSIPPKIVSEQYKFKPTHNEKSATHPTDISPSTLETDL